MKRLFRKVLIPLMGILAFFGISTSDVRATTIDQGTSLSSVNNTTPLYLSHAKAIFFQGQGQIAWHGSHYSHGSHSSHESHYSHYSSRY